MFAMFGVGPMEIVVVLVIGAILFGIPLALAVLVILLLRKNMAGPSYQQLLEENERLRQEIAALKERTREPT
jgi:hypothetical protein